MPRAFTDLERERLRSTLVQAARDALPRTGLRKTSVESLTRAAGISKGAFYLFFESREALWVEVLQAAEAEVRVALRAEVQRDAPERLSRVLRVMAHHLVEHPVLQVLADPEEVAWMMRSLPADVARTARLDDAAFFGDLYDSLVERGGAVAGLRPSFVTVPYGILGLVQQRDVLGEAFDGALAFLLESYVQALEPPRRPERRPR